MIKIAYVVNSLSPGGTEQLVVQMCRTFASEFGMSVVCLDTPGAWAAKLRRDGIPLYCQWRQPGLDFAMAIKLASFCRRNRVDIIHAHQCTPWFYSALSRVIYSTPRLLFEEHGRFFPEIYNRKRFIFNKHIIKPLTHKIVAVSEDVRKRLEQYEGLDVERIEVVYNGPSVDHVLTTERRREMRGDLGFTSKDFIVGTAGRFDPIKNLPLLLRGIASARHGTDAIKGLVVGDGPLFCEIVRLRNNLGLSDYTLMPGYRDDARRLIQCMDLFVLSSLSEGTSIALLEAMAAGVPVAVTDVGGNPEIVIKDQTGWVVPSDSVEALTAAILDAVTDSGKRQKLAEAGRRRFENRFTLDRMMMTYRRIYGEMLDDDI